MIYILSWKKHQKTLSRPLHSKLKKIQGVFKDLHRNLRTFQGLPLKIKDFSGLHVPTLWSFYIDFPNLSHCLSIVIVRRKLCLVTLRTSRVKWKVGEWNLWLTALFTNMRILKFKTQLTIAFFAADHLNGPLRKQNFTLHCLTGSKGHGFCFELVDFEPFCVFLFFKVRCFWS